jgi:hypothetical protein
MVSLFYVNNELTNVGKSNIIALFGRTNKGFVYYVKNELTNVVIAINI